MNRETLFKRALVVTSVGGLLLGFFSDLYVPRPGVFNIVECGVHNLVTGDDRVCIDPHNPTLLYDVNIIKSVKEDSENVLETRNSFSVDSGTILVSPLSVNFESLNEGEEIPLIPVEVIGSPDTLYAKPQGEIGNDQEKERSNGGYSRRS